MFVLNTINIVKCLNILAQSSSQQSIELNHFNSTHICCPHEYKMFDFKPCSLYLNRHLFGKHLTATLNTWHACVCPMMHRTLANTSAGPFRSPTFGFGFAQGNKPKTKEKASFKTGCQYNCLYDGLWGLQNLQRQRLAVPCSFLLVPPLHDIT